MSIHSVKRDQCHLVWDKTLKPILSIQSGETVTFDCLDASNGQITPSSTSATIGSLVFAQLDQVCGPIYIEGALPGDTLQVDVINLETAEWGWTGIIPGFGLLADEFTQPTLKIWKLENEKFEGEQAYAWFDESKGIKVPLRPFMGEMGVARGVEGQWSTIPPYNTGGNLDTKYLYAGSQLFLPIEVEGALFSIGDGHAAQGDGGTAIETPMKVTVRLTVCKDRPYTHTPHFCFKSPGANSLRPRGPEEYYCVTGIDPDLREATRSAARNMIEFLGVEHGLNRVEAYMLCSVAADLRMLEVVDMPNYTIGMMIPRSILSHS
ncbi:Acetamidase/Formamidase [Macrolepiota fuliginosa MF-IS2]|uniref:Acetamidase/Formamidase n=1 Tax=Macrolepiota fuliginosa MF-IS2 TaxID=1400762 RepID=A0A9P5XEM3_9AGAR|nr:Acetamidase/Formamidase [Macrolepiota fuliginosa MF-IS2]